MSHIHYLGIRHHGVGSAWRLRSALEALQPDTILIEGPADCNDLLPYLIDTAMHPPVALLAYRADTPERHIYYPFTTYSPEFQAIQWALQHQKTVKLIDIPVNIQLNQDNDDTTLIPQDPIGQLAQCAGYEDGESWWHDTFEQQHNDSMAVFAQIDKIMTALRENTTDDRNTLLREAYMRLSIAEYRKSADTIAVVCGAWHLPALQSKISQKDDKATIRSLPAKLPNRQIKTTWIPWTSNRLSRTSGYGAGVPAPMWYQHLWDYQNHPQWLEYWLGKIAQTLRSQGQIISTASLIETARLSHHLAVIRNRPHIGFEEVRDAVIACLCFGETLLWQHIAQTLLLGNRVGQIPDNLPLAPLLEDLQREQKRVRLKPDALPKTLDLDLRQETDRNRSILLHRLNLLDVGWGTLQAHNSRGTFRERWQLCWLPEYSVQLVEHLVYGNSIAQASSQKLSERLQADLTIDALAELVRHSIICDLPHATQYGLKRLDRCTTQQCELANLLNAIIPLVNISRYGHARAIDQQELTTLSEKLIIQSALALPRASRRLAEDEAEHYYQHINNAHQAIILAEIPTELLDQWWQALHITATDTNSNRLIAGLCTYLSYQGQRINQDTVHARLQYALSPALDVQQASQFFEGFFSHAIRELQYDTALLSIVESWLLSLDEEDFLTCLPLFRRVFSELDKTERQRLLHTIIHRADKNLIAYQHGNTALWQTHLLALTPLITPPKEHP